jgi:hypothetical protein
LFQTPRSRRIGAIFFMRLGFQLSRRNSDERK